MSTPQRIQLIHSTNSQSQQQSLQQSQQGTQWNTPNQQTQFQNNNLINSSSNQNNSSALTYSNQLMNSQQQQNSQHTRNSSLYSFSSQNKNHNPSQLVQTTQQTTASQKIPSNQQMSITDQISTAQQNQGRSSTQRSLSQSNAKPNIQQNIIYADEILDNSGDHSPTNKPSCWQTQRNNYLLNSPNQVSTENKGEHPSIVQSHQGFNSYKPQKVVIPAIQSSLPNQVSIKNQKLGNTPPKSHPLMRNNIINMAGSKTSISPISYQIQQPSGQMNNMSLQNNSNIQSNSQIQQSQESSYQKYQNLKNNDNSSSNINNSSIIQNNSGSTTIQYLSQQKKNHNPNNLSSGNIMSSLSSNQLPPHPSLNNIYQSQQNLNHNNSFQNNININSFQNVNNNNSNQYKEQNSGQRNSNNSSMWLNNYENQDKQTINSQDQINKLQEEKETFIGIIKSLKEKNSDFEKENISLRQELYELKIKSEEDKAQEITMFRLIKYTIQSLQIEQVGIRWVEITAQFMHKLLRVYSILKELIIFILYKIFSPNQDKQLFIEYLTQTYYILNQYNYI